MKKLVKILTVILSGMLVFSAVSCKHKNEEIPEPSRELPDLTVASEYDQGGLYDGITFTVNCYQKWIKASVKVDASLAYALGNAQYYFNYANTYKDTDGEEKTVVDKTETNNFDVLRVRTSSNNNDVVNPDWHPYVYIQSSVSTSSFLLPKADKGTIAVEFNLDAGDRRYVHFAIVDYDVIDDKIEYRKIKDRADFSGKSGDPQSDFIFDNIPQRNAYYSQEMNAGEGSYKAVSSFGESFASIHRTHFVLTVNSFSGYFDPASPLTDLYIGFGYRNTFHYLDENMNIFPSYGYLDLISRETDDEGNIIREQSRRAIEFMTADKRNQCRVNPQESVSIYARRGVLKVDDFIGDNGEIVFRFEVSQPKFWEETKIGDMPKNHNEIVMHYEKKNGKIFIGPSQTGFGG